MKALVLSFLVSGMAYSADYTCPENAAIAIAKAESTRYYLSNLDNDEVPDAEIQSVSYNSEGYYIEVLHEGFTSDAGDAVISMMIEYKNCNVAELSIDFAE